MESQAYYTKSQQRTSRAVKGCTDQFVGNESHKNNSLQNHVNSFTFKKKKTLKDSCLTATHQVYGCSSNLVTGLSKLIEQVRDNFHLYSSSHFSTDINKERQYTLDATFRHYVTTYVYNEINLAMVNSKFNPKIENFIIIKNRIIK